MDDSYTARERMLDTGVAQIIDFEFIVYGTEDAQTQRSDTFSEAFARYIAVSRIKANQLAKMIGISPSTISRYSKGERNIDWEQLCSVCIALRLAPCEQRHLFSLAYMEMPATK